MAEHATYYRELGAARRLGVPSARPDRLKDFAHGIVSRYDLRGCRCDACRDARAAYYRELRARKRARDG